MRSAITVCTAAFMLFSIGGSPRRASAQSESGAQSLLIDPSIRASAMGGASTAVIWGGDPNYWANPALLPYQHGIRYERGRTHLVPDLSPKVSFKTKRLLVGYGDVSIGRTTKTTDVFLAPASVTLDGRDARAKVTTYDSGVLFRATPYNSIDYPGIIPGVDRIAAVRVDVTHGRSTQNYNDARISYSVPTQADPVA